MHKSVGQTSRCGSLVGPHLWCPAALDQVRVQHLLPPVQALHIRAALQVGGCRCKWPIKQGKPAVPVNSKVLGVCGVVVCMPLFFG